MTPEERAEKCCDSNGLRSSEMDSYYLPVDLKERIAVAIRAAVAEERREMVDCGHPRACWKEGSGCSACWNVANAVRAERERVLGELMRPFGSMVIVSHASGSDLPPTDERLTAALKVSGP